MRPSPRRLELPLFALAADEGGPGEVHYRSPVHAATVVSTGHPRSASRVDSDRVVVTDQPPGANHLVPAGTEFWTAWREDAAWVQLTLPPGSLAALSAELLEGRAMDLAPRLDHVDPDLAALAGLMRRGLEAPGGPDPLYLEALGMAWVLRLLRGAAPTVAAPWPGGTALPPARLRRVRAHVRANLTGDLSLGALAAAAGLSRWHFLRAFRAATGVTPHAYVRAQRVEAAVELLRASRLPVAAVAARCGFGSLDQLYRAFKATEGTTPGALRCGVGDRLVRRPRG